MNVPSDISRLLERPREPRETLSIDAGDLYGIVTSRRRMLGPALAISFGIAFGYILLAPVRYTASMSVVIDPRDRVPAGADAQPAPQEPDPALVESQMRLMTSKAVLRRVIQSEDLLNDPSRQPGLLQSLISPVMALLSGDSAANLDPADLLAEDLGKQISTKRGERTYVVDVDVMACTQSGAVKLANALFAAYLEEQTKLRGDLVRQQTQFLDGRVNDLRPRVEGAERRVQEYRDANAIAVLDGHTSPEQQLGGANAALVAARGKVNEISARYTQLKAALAEPANLESTDDALQSPVVEKLRQDYAALARDEAYARTVLGPRHPSYLTTQAQLEATRSQIRAEIQRILSATERELKAAQASAQSAEKLLTNTEASTNKLGDRTLALTDLENEAKTLRATFEKTLTARENIRRDVVESPVSVLIDPPVASKGKTSPKILPALLIALAGGVNLWIAAALISDARQRRRRPVASPPDGRSAIPVPAARVLAPPRPAPFEGFVQHAPWPAGVASGSGGALGRANPGSLGRAISAAARAEPEFAAATRGIFDLLRRAARDAEAAPRILLLSPGGGDPAGAVLALSLARMGRLQGRSVLIVDGDGAHSALAQFARDQNARFGVAGGPFDLALICCGSPRIAGKAIEGRRGADALVAVRRGGAFQPEWIEELTAEGLAKDCIGVVVFPEPDAERLRA